MKITESGLKEAISNQASLVLLCKTLRSAARKYKIGSIETHISQLKNLAKNIEEDSDHLKKEVKKSSLVKQMKSEVEVIKRLINQLAPIDYNGVVMECNALIQTGAFLRSQFDTVEEALYETA